MSFSEGFGIPVIEAAARGSKTIISNIPALVEIAPKNSLILDLDDQSNHVNLILGYLSNSSRPDPAFVLQRWNWKSTAIKLKKFITLTLNPNK